MVSIHEELMWWVLGPVLYFERGFMWWLMNLEWPWLSSRWAGLSHRVSLLNFICDVGSEYIFECYICRIFLPVYKMGMLISTVSLKKNLRTAWQPWHQNLYVAVFLFLKRVFDKKLNLNYIDIILKPLPLHQIYSHSDDNILKTLLSLKTLEQYLPNHCVVLIFNCILRSRGTHRETFFVQKTMS